VTTHSTRKVGAATLQQAALARAKTVLLCAVICWVVWCYAVLSGVVLWCGVLCGAMRVVVSSMVMTQYAVWRWRSGGDEADDFAIMRKYSVQQEGVSVGRTTLKAVRRGVCEWRKRASVMSKQWNGLDRYGMRLSTTNNTFLFLVWVISGSEEECFNKYAMQIRL